MRKKSLVELIPGVNPYISALMQTFSVFTIKLSVKTN